MERLSLWSLAWDALTSDPDAPPHPLVRAWETLCEAGDAVELYNKVLSLSETPEERIAVLECSTT